MLKVPQSKINEIAREIALGNTCYLQKSTRKITIIDHSIKDLKLLAAQEQVQIKFELKMNLYVKFEKLSAANQLVIMEDFVEELSDKSIRKQLSNSLNRKNPVRNFMSTIENDLELNQHWRNFNIQEYQRWVYNTILEAYN